MITIPDGNKIKVEPKGTIYLRGLVTLENVLHVPGFQFNLISVSKLCYDVNCSISFVKNTCLLQDLSLNKQIMLGRPKKGFYIPDASLLSPIFADLLNLITSLCILLLLLYVLLRLKKPNYGI